MKNKDYPKNRGNNRIACRYYHLNNVYHINICGDNTVYQIFI